MARDPVCLMVLQPEAVYNSSKYKGKFYYFCSNACKKAFDKDPQDYLKRKWGWWSRFLERLAKSSRESFGNTPPTCH